MTEQQKLYEPSKNEENPWVMYLIVRSSLGMGTGKIAAQAGHAVGMIYNRYLRLALKHALLNVNSSESALMEAFADWDTHGNRKVVLRADDQQFEKVKAEITTYVVRDAGLTEVEAGSETVIALWPAQKNSLPKIIRKLQLLK